MVGAVVLAATVGVATDAVTDIECSVLAAVVSECPIPDVVVDE